MITSKFLRATTRLLANGTSKNPAFIRFKSIGGFLNDSDKCMGSSGKPTGKCTKKVAPGCRTPNASVKCVSLSKETPCEKIRPPHDSFLEMLQAQDVFKLQKSCPNECCCLVHYIPRKNRIKISWTDIRHVVTRC